MHSKEANEHNRRRLVQQLTQGQVRSVPSKIFIIGAINKFTYFKQFRFKVVFCSLDRIH